MIDGWSCPMDFKVKLSNYVSKKVKNLTTECLEEKMESGEFDEILKEEVCAVVGAKVEEDLRDEIRLILSLVA